MQQVWKSRKDGEEFFKQSKNFREFFATMLKETKMKREVTEADYDTPSWSHKQAHLNGHNAAINEILKLLNGD